MTKSRTLVCRLTVAMFLLSICSCSPFLSTQFIKDVLSSNQGAIPSVPPQEVNNLSLRLKSNINNNELTDLFISKNETTFTPITSISGNAEFIGTNLNSQSSSNNLYFLTSKNNSSPADWTELSLWHTNGTSEGTTKIVAVPSTVSDCDIYDYSNKFILNCRTYGPYLVRSYEYNKDTKTFKSLSEVLNIPDDNNFTYAAGSQSYLQDGTFIVEVYRIPQNNQNAPELHKLYLHNENMYYEITSDSLQRDRLVTLTDFSFVQNLKSVGNKKQGLLSSYLNYSTSYLDLVEIENNHISVTPVYGGTRMDYLGITNNTLLFINQNESFVRKYDSLSKTLINTAIPTRQNLSHYILTDSSIYIFDDYIDFSTDQSLKKCNLDYNCQTIIPRVQDLNIMSVSSSLRNKKLYFTLRDTPDSSNNLKFISLDNGVTEVDQPISNYMRQNSIPFSTYLNIIENSKYKILTINNYHYHIFNKTNQSYLDKFDDACVSSDIEESYIKYNKYFYDFAGFLKAFNAFFGCA